MEKSLFTTKNISFILYTMCSLAFLLIICMTGCGKNENESSPSNPIFVDRIDSLNFIIVEGDTIYHRIVNEPTYTSDWDFKFKIRDVRWWNKMPYNYVYFYLSTNSGTVAHFAADITLNDSTFLKGSNYTPVPILHLTGMFKFENVKMYSDYPTDTNTYFLLSGLCRY